MTGKIYHVKNFPPENEEISARLTTRSDDTFEKVSVVVRLSNLLLVLSSLVRSIDVSILLNIIC